VSEISSKTGITPTSKYTASEQESRGKDHNLRVSFLMRRKIPYITYVYVPQLATIET